MKNKILEALFHIRKEQTIQFYCLNSERCLFKDGTAYALANDCFPYFSPKSAEFEEFDDVFLVKRAFIELVLDYIDAENDENRCHTYYELENHFGGKPCRDKLRVVLRYAYLEGILDSNEFWERLLEDGGYPIGLQNINKPFDVSELLEQKW